MSSAWTEHPDPARRGAGHLRWVAAALSLSILRRPTEPARPGRAWSFALAALFWLLAGLVLDDLLIEPPREFSQWALTERSFPLLLCLAGAALLSASLRRGAVALEVASVSLLALLPATLLWIWAQARLELSPWLHWLPALYFGLFSFQLVRWTGTGASPGRKAAASALAAAWLIAGWQWVPDSPWWWAAEDEAEIADTADTRFTDASPGALAGLSAEQLWEAQPKRLSEALAALAPQEPGRIDLYVLALAGDGGESVFRNEVGYVRRLAEQRLGATGRVLPLVNHPQTLDAAPIASVGNLRRALQGLAEVMDPEEDLLWIFLTSHGSEDHQLYLGLDPLPLDWLDPPTLRALLDESGIGWRIIVVSACYSGGFVEALRDERSLVITAARADRPSFGCGAQSEITWFGEAFLVDSLNLTLDFSEAFREARTRIRDREREEGERPSHPQIALGQQIAPRLERWRDGLAEAKSVPFAVGLPVAEGKSGAEQAEAR